MDVKKSADLSKLQSTVQNTLARKKIGKLKNYDFSRKNVRPKPEFSIWYIRVLWRFCKNQTNPSYRYKDIERWISSTQKTAVSWNFRQKMLEISSIGIWTSWNSQLTGTFHRKFSPKNAWDFEYWNLDFMKFSVDGNISSKENRKTTGKAKQKRVKKAPQLIWVVNGRTEEKAHRNKLALPAQYICNFPILTFMADNRVAVNRNYWTLQYWRLWWMNESAEFHNFRALQFWRLYRICEWQIMESKIYVVHNSET